MPNQRKPGTRPRTVAMDDELWAAVGRVAVKLGVSWGAAAREALREFVRKHSTSQEADVNKDDV